MTQPRRQGAGGGSWWVWTCAGLALLLATPLAGVLFSLTQEATPGWAETAPLVLPRYLFNTAVLVLLTGLGVALTGTVTAWIVVMYRFPGRPILELLLALPLAMPGYVMAYAYAHTLQFAGPVQSALRLITGWEAGDYWFPEIRSTCGAAFVLTFALYPYVYLTARASFIEQSVCALEVGRTLGRGPFRLFTDVALPLARPAILAGLALAVMETLADFGTVDYLGVQTFTTGIYRTYFSLGDPVAASQLASVLLGFVLVMVLTMRAMRGRGRTFGATTRYRALPKAELSGFAAAGAALVCFLPVLFGFLAPVGILINLLMGHATLDTARLMGLALNSVTLAAIAAFITIALALFFAYGLRLTRSRLVWIASGLASFNYAVPGSIIAIGLVAPLTGFDVWLSNALGYERSLVISGSVAGLLFLYVARFYAAAAGATRASLARVTPSMDAAARCLGRGPLQAAWAVHLPVMAPSLLSGALIVFVDVMKELPGTLILRPFNFDTLSVAAYQLAVDERITELGGPALAIVLAGLIPVALLMHAIARGRAGAQPAEIEEPYFQPARS